MRTFEPKIGLMRLFCPSVTNFKQLFILNP